jgi:hypothetical protein
MKPPVREHSYQYSNFITNKLQSSAPSPVCLNI